MLFCIGKWSSSSNCKQFFCGNLLIHVCKLKRLLESKLTLWSVFDFITVICISASLGVHHIFANRFFRCVVSEPKITKISKYHKLLQIWLKQIICTEVDQSWLTWKESDIGACCYRVPENIHRRTGRCGVLLIVIWAAWFWAAQGRLLTKKKEERKGRKGRFNIFATAGLRIQSAPENIISIRWVCRPLNLVAVTNFHMIVLIGSLIF